ncbi:beta-galactosidase [Deinococcus yavapaiensis]|uniref:Beta-galactosidase n=1 Tax=Deinococcus yavapaiensis KR-236 TaxID=694435 RepID=A0A318S7W8_9DEIO|nr:beta-galactosidase [Deinococcus yavapaiensis]PYE53828.1 beta-galactosidase [Deinococcus yavapaiensis KR-236]
MTDLDFEKIAYGGDWNPEQWDRDVWREDVRLFREAGIDLLSINIFAWTMLQPDEDTYDFTHLDEIFTLLHAHGMRVCLGTATAAHPAWMATRYPDILRVDAQGRKRKFGNRHNSCPSSPTYRRFAPRLAGALAERYAAHPALALWHVSNEFSGACYCERCEGRFREWLRARYGTLEALNHAWNARFWNQTVTDWDEIVAPNVLSVQAHDRRTVLQGLSLDYLRFNSDNILDTYVLEERAIRAHHPDAVITTNLMGAYRSLDYRAWAPHLDVIAWDSYPGGRDTPPRTAMLHDLMRGLKDGQPFLLMEQTPSQTNWQPFNALKRPGVMRLQSYHAVAHGAEAVMFFQMRRSPGAGEKFHGAVIEHHGRADTRVFREVAALGEELRRLGNVTLGKRIRSRTAVWFDWESWWASENSLGPSQALDYVEQVAQMYDALYANGVAVDLVGPGSDLSGYEVLAAPVLYLLHPETVDALSAFVKRGGHLVTTFLSGVADVSDRVFPGGPPGPLRALLGLWVEEIDALAPEVTNRIVLSEPLGELKGAYDCNLLFDIIRVEGAEVLGTYEGDFYAGTPALTRHAYGEGYAWHVASSAEPEFLRKLFGHLCREQRVEPTYPNLPVGVEAVVRGDDDDHVLFLLNHGSQAVTVPLVEAVRDLLGGGIVKDEVRLPPYGVLVGRPTR